jgi:hypothetical protein
MAIPVIIRGLLGSMNGEIGHKPGQAKLDKQTASVLLFAYKSKRRREPLDNRPDPYQKRSVFVTDYKIAGWMPCNNGYMRGTHI